MPPEEDKLFILPCGGTSPQGCLVHRAAQELVLEQKAEWLTPEQVEIFCNHTPLENKTARFIIVDGCTRKCSRQSSAEININTPFYLCLEDIGIDEISAEIDGDALQLVKDAIIAVSTRAPDRIPMIPGCCC